MKQKEKFERNFEGIWITKEVWESKDLSVMEKCLLMEIKSLDKDDNIKGGCFASNEYFADFFSISKVQVSNYISRLKEKGYIIEKGFDGKSRILKCVFQLQFSFKENFKAKLGLKKTLNLPQRKLKGRVKENFKHNNIYNNTNNKDINISNKIYNKEDTELTNLLYELVKQNYPFIIDRKTEKQIISDYEEMDKINRIDKKNYKLIEFIIRFSQQDDFWKQNIRSVSKLRKQFDNLMVRAKSHVEGKVIKDYDL